MSRVVVIPNLSWMRTRTPWCWIRGTDPENRGRAGVTGAPEDDSVRALALAAVGAVVRRVLELEATPRDVFELLDVQFVVLGINEIVRHGMLLVKEEGLKSTFHACIAHAI
jgi:hypothetical protein